MHTQCYNSVKHVDKIFYVLFHPNPSSLSHHFTRFVHTNTLPDKEFAITPRTVNTCTHREWKALVLFFLYAGGK